MPRPRNKLYPTPDDAESAFYDAFERGDLAAMMAVWAATDEIVCIHPQGPRLVGFDAVREGWSRIFAGGSQLRVRTTEMRAFDSQTLAVHSVVELVAPPGEQAQVSSIFATNVFELTDGGWRMIATTPPRRLPKPRPSAKKRLPPRTRCTSAGNSNEARRALSATCLRSAGLTVSIPGPVEDAP